MAPPTLILALIGWCPFLAAWRSLRRTSLAHALVWSFLAYAAWLLLWCFLPLLLPANQAILRQLALLFTCAPGIAVLGARRPHVPAWNFVVLGLLAVLLLPLLENLFLGVRSTGELRTLFTAATLAVTFLNYLPTRFFPAAILAALGCATQFPGPVPIHLPLLPFFRIHGGDLLLALVPWTAWACAVFWGRKERTSFDRTWLWFRDAFGLVWAYRIREQFNAAARNANWNVHLAWTGLEKDALRSPENPAIPEMEKTLRAILRRFDEPQLYQ